MIRLKRLSIILKRKFTRNRDLTPEASTLQYSLICLLTLGIIVNITALLYVTNIMVFVRLSIMYAIFLGSFICLRLNLVSIPKLQLVTIITLVAGLASGWFYTNGLLGSIIFAFLIITTLGNTLLPTKYHKLFIGCNLLIIITLSFIEFKYPHLVHNPYASVNSQKMYAMILVLIGIPVCGLIITFFKRGYEKAHKKLHDQNLQLQKTNHELDNLIYSISHDLRAPIASIMGLVSLHKDITQDEEAKRYIELEERALNNLDKFIQELLAYSRVNRMELHIEKIELQDLINEIIEQYSHFQNHPVDVVVDCELTQPFYSDKTQLRIALQNLINNAINYADFSKSNPYCTINVKQNPTQIEIEIADNGIGVDEKHGNKIFDMFYRANNKTTGSGLGLYIVREALSKMKGTIRFKSAVNQGTTFHLTLPNLKPKTNRKDNMIIQGFNQ